MLLRDGHDSQVLPRQDGNHETLHGGGGEVVHGHDGPVLRCALMLSAVVDEHESGGFDAKWFLFQDNAKRRAMLLAFEKHNKLMAEAQEGQGECTWLIFYSC